MTPRSPSDIAYFCLCLDEWNQFHPGNSWESRDSYCHGDDLGSVRSSWQERKPLGCQESGPGLGEGVSWFTGTGICLLPVSPSTSNLTSVLRAGGGKKEDKEEEGEGLGRA